MGYFPLRVRTLHHNSVSSTNYSSHVRFLKFAKQTIPNTYLIAGVTGDEGIKTVQGPTAMSAAERAEVIHACKYVDEVVEDCPSTLLPEFVLQFHIDDVGYSEELLPMTTPDPYEFLKLQGKVFVMPRT